MNKSKKNNMVDLITKNWELMLGSGAVTSGLTWLFYGRKNNNIDYLSKQQAVFDKLQDEMMKDRDYYKKEYLQAREEHKKEVLYFRTKIDEVTKRADTLQGQFNNMSISYTKEVEVSQNWEKLYRELTIQNKELEKSNGIILAENESIKKEQSELKLAHEKLKIDHEKLKKAFNLQQKTIVSKTKKP